MADDDTWPVTIFLKCQVATIRQMFHRLCIHVIQKLRYKLQQFFVKDDRQAGSLSMNNRHVRYSGRGQLVFDGTRTVHRWTVV